MAKIPTLPADFRVDCSHHRPCAVWTDKTRRYHFWLTDNGRPVDCVLHSNPVNRNPNAIWEEYSALNLNAKARAPLIAVILETIKRDGLMRKAREVEAARMLRNQEAARNAYEGKLLDAFYGSIGQLPPAQREAMELLPRAVKLEFASAFAQEFNSH